MRARPARMAIAIAALAVVLALPAGASAATVSTDRACYNADGSDAVTVSGTGFSPGAQVNVLVDNKVASTPLTAGADGSVTTKLPVPNPPQGGPTAHDRAYGLRLQQSDDAGAVASTTFNAVDVLADYTPGNASTLGKVRFMAFGLGLKAGSATPSIFIHYVDPRGKVKKTIALGKSKGPCGSIRKTKRMPVFPFNPRSGKWTLQFDTAKKYVKNAPGSYALKLSL